MRAVLGFTLIFLGMFPASRGRDCTFSKEFQIKHAQALAGVLQDSLGVILPGIELELLSGKKVVRHLRTSNQGTYDFGEVPAGKYRIHIRSAGDAFYAPKVRCGKEECSVEPKLMLSSKKLIVVE